MRRTVYRARRKTRRPHTPIVQTRHLISACGATSRMGKPLVESVRQSGRPDAPRTAHSAWADCGFSAPSFERTQRNGKSSYGGKQASGGSDPDSLRKRGCLCPRPAGDGWRLPKYKQAKTFRCYLPSFERGWHLFCMAYRKRQKGRSLVQLSEVERHKLRSFKD